MRFGVFSDIIPHLKSINFVTMFCMIFAWHNLGVLSADFSFTWNWPQLCQANIAQKNNFENEWTLIWICNFTNFLVIHGFFFGKFYFFRWFSVILFPLNRLASRNTFCPGEFWMLPNSWKWLVIWPGHVANGPKNRCSNQGN